MNKKNIKSLMIRYDHNQRSLSKHLFISKLALNNKLNGKSEFKESELISMADLFNVSIDYLLERGQ